MTIQLALSGRTARLTGFTSNLSNNASLRIFTGAQPADCQTAQSGTVLASITMATPFTVPANGTMQLSNLPLTTTATTSGTAGYYRIVGSSQGTSSCFMQGSIGQGSGDLQFDNTSIQTGQTINITAWTVTDGNA
jgi:hypothetical protein